MANTIRWFDRNWNQVASAAIGSLSLVGGVYFDGHHYWITEQTTGSVQAFSLEGGSFNRIKQWALPAGYSDPTGITGDGLDLYVAATHTDAGPPVVVTRRISKYTKDGVFLFDINTGAPTSITEIDLDFNGQNVLRYVAGTATGEQIIQLDPTSTAAVYASPDLPRLPHACCFDGHNHAMALIVAGSYFGALLDDNANVLQALTALPAVQPRGMTFIRDGLGDQGTPDLYGGDGYAIAYRA